MTELLNSVGPYLDLVGRILYAAIFIRSGVNHLTKTDMLTQYAAAYKVPAARTLVIVSGVMILVGGLAVLTGWHPRVGAVLIFVALVGMTYYMHGYWRETEPMSQVSQMTHFMKNVAMAGAALLIIVRGTGPLSLGR
ncbi:MAG: DoxX family protein [Armatimonadetes bacterium]|nr:DoxX family protein [Armatimonadota bacterium]